MCVWHLTITLSNEGTAHSFGRNEDGELGLGHNKDVSLPTPIPNLPQIDMVSCGARFTVCVDCEGFIWSFGESSFGQLGTVQTKQISMFLKNFKMGSFFLFLDSNENVFSAGNNLFTN